MVKIKDKTNKTANPSRLRVSSQAVERSANGEFSTAGTAVADSAMFATSAMPDLQTSGLAKREMIKQNSRLLRMPKEIQQRIFEFAVTEDDPIRPVQVVAHANKFIWSKAQIVFNDPKREHLGHKKVVSNAPPLAAVTLSHTCKEIYDAVALTHLFYKKNQFDFDGMTLEAAITYLVAITKERKIQMKHISLTMPCFRQAWEEFMCLMTTIKNLESVKISFATAHTLRSFVDYAPTAQVMKSFLELVGGLKAVEFIAPTSEPSYYFAGTGITDAQIETLINKLNNLVSDRLGLGNKKCAIIDQTLIRRAEALAKLDIHGEGRLSNDKKPGMVSSRTRAANRSLTLVDHNGVIPRRVTPKYDLSGDLAWHVYHVNECRQTSLLDGEPDSFEFLLDISPDYATTPADRVFTWEDITVLNSISSRSAILRFYQIERNYDACGREEVLKIWKMREDQKQKPTRQHISSLNAVSVKKAKRDAFLEAKAKADENKTKAEEKRAKALKRMVKPEAKNIKAEEKKPTATLKPAKAKVPKTSTNDRSTDKAE